MCSCGCHGTHAQGHKLGCGRKVLGYDWTFFSPTAVPTTATTTCSAWMEGA